MGVANLGGVTPRNPDPKLWQLDDFRRPASLIDCFESINAKHFDSFLDPPVLRWNSRLRSSAGRFIPGSRKYSDLHPPIIEIASYLLEERDCAKYVLDTLAHEMIHYWLWVRHRPYGHTVEFHERMNEMGVSRYNPIPRVRPPKYIYRCPACAQEFPARRTLGVLACAKCCRKHTGGKFDSRFRLVLDRHIRSENEIENQESMVLMQPENSRKR
jgi:predicted SprT family Zn-dependent metalloprotease